MFSHYIHRWVQWGIYSPVFRTHCTKNYNNDRRIWVYPYVSVATVYNTPHAINTGELQDNAYCYEAQSCHGSYIYTEARAAYDTGIYAMKLSNRTFTTCL